MLPTNREKPKEGIDIEETYKNDSSLWWNVISSAIEK